MGSEANLAPGNLSVARRYARSLAGFQGNFPQICGLCLSPRFCLPLGRYDLEWGHGLELSISCPEALLPQSVAPSTSCIHTLMCLCTYLCLDAEWQRS